MSGFKIRGADGKPVVVPDGQYYFNPKARVRRMMLNSLSSEARRGYACLELATMGFQQELAVVAIGKDKTRPMTPSDIVEQTGLSKQHVRRALAELEAEGLAERRAADGGTALQKGQVRIYSWAVPRTAGSKNGSRARLPFPDWFPKSWEPLKPFITRLKLQISIDEVAARDYLSEGEEAARAYQKAEKVVTRFLERVCARPKTAAHKEKEQKELLKEPIPSGGRLVIPAEKPPARPPDGLDEKLRPYLKNRPIGIPLDDAMYEQICSHLTEALFDQFKAAADEVKNPRKWAVYLAVAEQVEARGPMVKAAAAGSSKDKVLARMKQDAERAKSWQTS
jgi:DNA-binding transcriptional ArsR family regulator